MTDSPPVLPHMTPSRTFWIICASLLIGLCLSACGSQPSRINDLPAPPSPPIADGAPINPPNVMNVPDAVPRVEPRSRYGNPETYVAMGQEYRVLSNGLNYVERGGASWYGTKFHGQRTSSGEPYDLYAMTAAHRTLPIPSYARVTNLANNRSVVVRINDRGPFHSDRIIDLSYTAAMKLGIFGHGTGQVEVRAIDPLAAQNPAAYLANAGAQNSRERVAPRTPAPHAAALPPVTNSRTTRVAARPPAPIATPSDAGPTATTRSDTASADSHAPAASGVGQYLQAGAFGSYLGATDLVARLRDAGFKDLRITPTSDGKTTLYRVLIGPLAGKEAVVAINTRLSQFGIDRPQTEQAESRSPAAGAKLYLQLGTFSTYGNASDLVERLQRGSFRDLRILPTTKLVKPLYRVLLGPLASADDAQRMRSRLTDFGIEPPLIVKD